jgi:hypothetical protein
MKAVKKGVGTGNLKVEYFSCQTGRMSRSQSWKTNGKTVQVEEQHM